MLAGLYGSFYRQVRKLSDPSLRTFWLALLLFVLIRGLTDTEPFDLSLPLWAIVMTSVLMEDRHAQDAKESVLNLSGEFHRALTAEALTPNR